MAGIAVVGLDLAKNVFQVHGVGADGAMWFASNSAVGRC